MGKQIAINADCMEYMRTLPDKAFDLAIVDPPYFSGPERRGYYGNKVSPIGVHRDYLISPKWDIPGTDYFSQLVRVAKSILYGGVITLVSFSHRGASFGTSATTTVLFQTARSRRQTSTIAFASFVICGTECFRGKVSRTAQFSKETRH